MGVTATWDEKGVSIVFEGSFSIVEFLYGQKKIIEDPRIKVIRYKIIDLTNADLSSIQLEDVIFIVSAIHEQAIRTPGHISTFVTTNSHTKEFFEAFREEMHRLDVKWKIEIFPTHEDAKTWVDAELSKQA